MKKWKEVYIGKGLWEMSDNDIDHILTEIELFEQMGKYKEALDIDKYLKGNGYGK